MIELTKLIKLILAMRSEEGPGVVIELQCPPLDRITLGQLKSEYNKRMIELTDEFCVLLKYRRVSNF